MVDAPKELILKERATSLVAKGGMSGGVGANTDGVERVDDAPTTQIHSIDTFLGDTYELRYQLA